MAQGAESPHIGTKDGAGGSESSKSGCSGWAEHEDSMSDLLEEVFQWVARNPKIRRKKLNKKTRLIPRRTRNDN